MQKVLYLHETLERGIINEHFAECCKKHQWNSVGICTYIYARRDRNIFYIQAEIRPGQKIQSGLEAIIRKLFIKG